MKISFCLITLNEEENLLRCLKSCADLADEIVIAEEDVRVVVQSVQGVIGCEKIRTRGSADYAFLDLHLWLDGDMPLQAAHATSHVVKDRLMAKFQQLVDVVIHIEPPPHSTPNSQPEPHTHSQRNS